MTRRVLVFSTVTAILAVVVTGHAQTTRFYRVAWVTPTPAAEESLALNAFRQELRQRGYMQGENITVEHRSVEAKPDQISAIMAELIRLNAGRSSHRIARRPR